MFELWKEDMSRVRLDANSQASGYVGSVWVDRTNWTEFTNVRYPYARASVAVPDSTVFVLFGTTDGQAVGIQRIYQASGYKVIDLLATGRAGFTIYCFGARVIPVSNSGLQLLDIAGNVTFDSGAKWLRLSGVINNPVTATEYPWPAGVPTIAAGISYTGTWIQRNQVGQFSSFIFFTHAIRVSTGTVSVQPIPQQGPINEFPPSSTPEPARGSIIFADVTRY